MKHNFHAVITNFTHLLNTFYSIYNLLSLQQSWISCDGVTAQWFAKARRDKKGALIVSTRSDFVFNLNILYTWQYTKTGTCNCKKLNIKIMAVGPLSPNVCKRLADVSRTDGICVLFYTSNAMLLLRIRVFVCVW